ncbi:MAG TPA: hypothetical protein VFE53_00260 [Mucilaginibacter sp.]|jgi:hypothetical protein|nr:hypothetical protein [Mucilaginibacter sp.]
MIQIVHKFKIDPKLDQVKKDLEKALARLDAFPKISSAFYRTASDENQILLRKANGLRKRVGKMVKEFPK